MAGKVKKLSSKRQRFVSEYLIDGNATRAAKAAGYSEKTAHSQGPRLLEKVDIQQALEKAKQKQQARLEYGADDVIKGFIEKAYSDDEGIQIKALENLGKHFGIYKKDNEQANRIVTLNIRSRKSDG